MAQFAPSTREHFHSLYGRPDLQSTAPAAPQNHDQVHGYGAYGAYGESSFDRRLRGEHVILPDGSVVAFNLAHKTALVLIDPSGKPTKETHKGAVYTALYEQAKRGRFISAEQSKRMQEDAGRKYKTAATRIPDNLLYKTYRDAQSGAVYELTPSFIKVTYPKDFKDNFRTYNKGQAVVIKNSDKDYKTWASHIEGQSKKFNLILVSRETSADKSRRRQTARAKLDPAITGKTWNDGKYTYKVAADGSIKVKDKTWKPGQGDYDTVARNLNVAFKEKSLKSGALEDSAELDESGMKELKAELTMDETGAKTAAEEEAAPSGESVASSSAPEEKVEIREGKGKKEGLTGSPYFWPAVGAGVLALGVGGYFLLRKKE